MRIMLIKSASGELALHAGFFLHRVTPQLALEIIEALKAAEASSSGFAELVPDDQGGYWIRQEWQ